MLSLVLPKGSLEPATLSLFSSADLAVRRGSERDYHASVDDPRIDRVRFLRPQEIPEYVAFYNQNRDRGVEVVGVVFDSGDPEEVLEFVREHKIPYRQLVGNDDILDLYQANYGFPTTFVIDRKGTILSKTVGSPPKKFEKIQSDVEEALQAQASTT